MGKWGRPSKAAIAKTRKAKKKEYEQLAQAALKAVINREYDILLIFPYFVKFQRGFPKGILIEHTDETRTFRTKSRKLLDWLFEKGYSTCNSAQVVKACIHMERQMNRYERMFEQEDLDNESDNRYNSDIRDKEEV